MSASQGGEAIEVLLVEDDPADIRLAMECFKHCKMANRLHVVKDGVEAMAFLRREEGYADAPRAGLILLDLNLPKQDGREVLVEIKSDPVLRKIPVVIRTTSSEEEDVLKSYERYANCYITKPFDMSQFVAVVRSIEDFWLTIAKLPPWWRK